MWAFLAQDHRDKIKPISCLERAIVFLNSPFKHDGVGAHPVAFTILLGDNKLVIMMQFVNRLDVSPITGLGSWFLTPYDVMFIQGRHSKCDHSRFPLEQS